MLLTAALTVIHGVALSSIWSEWIAGLFQAPIERPADTHQFPTHTGAPCFSLLPAAIWLPVRNNVTFVLLLSSPGGKKN